MEFEVRAPITVNTFDKTFVEQSLARMEQMFAEIKTSQQALNAKFDALVGDEATVQRLTEEARRNREGLQNMQTELSDATADAPTPQE